MYKCEYILKLLDPKTAAKRQNHKNIIKVLEQKQEIDSQEYARLCFLLNPDKLISKVKNDNASALGLFNIFYDVGFMVQKSKNLSVKEKLFIKKFVSHIGDFLMPDSITLEMNRAYMELIPFDNGEERVKHNVIFNDYEILVFDEIPDPVGREIQKVYTDYMTEKFGNDYLKDKAEYDAKKQLKNQNTI